MIELPGKKPEVVDVKICPFMSGAAVPTAVVSGAVVRPNEIDIKPAMVTCQREGCALWDEVQEHCTLRVTDLDYSVGGIASTVQGLASVLEPAKNGPVSALSAIEKSLARLCDLVEGRFPAKKS